MNSPPLDGHPALNQAADQKDVPARAAGWVIPAAFVFFILLPIVVYFLDRPLEALGVLGDAIRSRDEAVRLGRLLGRSVWIAALAATLGTAIGVLFFVAFHPLATKRRAAVWCVVAAPFLVPGQIVAIAWIQACGRAGWLTGLVAGAGPFASLAGGLPSTLYSTIGCALVMALHLYPIALALAWLGWRATARAPLEAAATLMPPGRLWRTFLAGWIRPWLLVAWLILFILCLLDYSVPLLLRRHVFTVEIVSAYDIYFDAAQARGLALPLLAISLAASALLARILAPRRWPALGRGAGRSATLPPLNAGGQRVLVGFGLIVASLALLVPLGTLLGMAGGWGAYRNVFISAREQVLTSLWCSAGATAGCLALAAGLVVMGTWRPRRVHRGQVMIGAAMAALFALPASVAAMAHIGFWNRAAGPALARAFYDSGLMLPLGLVTVTLPVAWWVLHARIRQTPPVLIEGEQLQPVGAARRWWELTAPRLGRPVMAAAALVFVLCMHEVQTSILLAAPGQATMSIRSMTLLHYAPDSLVAAFCLIQVAVLLVGLALLWGAGYLVKIALGRWAPHHAID